MAPVAQTDIGGLARVEQLTAALWMLRHKTPARHHLSGDRVGNRRGRERHDGAGPVGSSLAGSRAVGRAGRGFGSPVQGSSGSQPRGVIESRRVSDCRRTSRCPQVLVCTRFQLKAENFFADYTLPILVHHHHPRHYPQPPRSPDPLAKPNRPPAAARPQRLARAPPQRTVPSPGLGRVPRRAPGPRGARYSANFRADTATTASSNCTRAPSPGSRPASPRHHSLVPRRRRAPRRRAGPPSCRARRGTASAPPAS